MAQRLPIPDFDTDYSSLPSDLILSITEKDFETYDKIILVSGPDIELEETFLEEVLKISERNQLVCGNDLLR